MSQSASRSAIVVSGASTGIGLATAQRLARRGHRVFAGVRKASDADALRDSAGVAIEPLLFDVCDPAAIAAAAKDVAAEVGDAGLGGIVANAGIAVSGPLEFIDVEKVRLQLDVNVLGVLRVVQAFLPGVRQGHGRVVMTGSIGGRNATPLIGPYAASKFALEGLAEAWRRELAPFGIHVALIEPGAIATPMMQGKREAQSAEVLDSLEGEARRLYEPLARGVMGRFERFAKQAIPPERVAEAIEHALTASRPKARYLVGTDAKVQALIAGWLPDGARDAIFARLLGLPRGG